MTLVDDLETVGAMTPALRARERDLFVELIDRAPTADPSRIDAWVRALGLWFDDALGYLPQLMLEVDDLERAAAVLRTLLPCASHEGQRRIHVGLARLGHDTSGLGRLIDDDTLPAGIGLQLAVAHDLVLSDALGARFAARVAAALSSARSQPAFAEAVKLPLSARCFGRHAAVVLRVLLEERSLRPFFADRAARLWLELDLHDALPSALGAADEVSSMTLLALATTVNREEAFDLLETRFKRDPFFAELMSRAGAALLRDEDRWVAPAMERMATEPEVAVRLLRHIGGPRAMDELTGVVDRRLEEGALDDVVVQALEALELRESIATCGRLFIEPAMGLLLQTPRRLQLRIADVIRPIREEVAALVGATGDAQALDALEEIVPLEEFGLYDPPPYDDDLPPDMPLPRNENTPTDGMGELETDEDTPVG